MLVHAQRRRDLHRETYLGPRHEYDGVGIDQNCSTVLLLHLTPVGFSLIESQRENLLKRITFSCGSVSAHSIVSLDAGKLSFLLCSARFLSFLGSACVFEFGSAQDAQ